MSLSDTLGSIPGYGGYQAARLRNEAQESSDLEQLGKLQSVVANMEKMRQQQALTANPAQLKDPEFWSRMAVVHNKPEYETHAERLRKDQGNAQTLETMRGAKTVIAPDPQEVAQGADQGTPVPAPVVQRSGGIFDSLEKSEYPSIAQQAKVLRAAMERSSGSVPSQYWQSQQAQLAAKETALLNRPEKGAEPLHPIVGPDGKAVLVSRSEAVGKQPFIASQSGDALLGPDELKFMAAQYRAGDRTVLQNLGRGAQGAENVVKLRREITKQAIAEGASPKDVAAAIAEFEGFKAGQRTLGTREAQVQLAADVTKQFAPLAVEASEKFDRTPYKSLNDVEKAVLSRTASPELRRFNFANTTLINSYARAINPNGVGTVSDKDHAREILDTGFSKGDYKAAVDQLQMEIDAELRAPGSVKGRMRQFFTGQQPTAPAPAAAPNAPTGWSIRPKGG